MISDGAWLAFASYIKISGFFCAHPFEVTQDGRNETKIVRLIVTKSKVQLVLCYILTVYLVLDNLYLTIALNFTGTTFTYAEFIKNYLHWLTRCGAGGINIAVLSNRDSFVLLLNTMSGVFTSSIQDVQYKLSNPRNIKLLQLGIQATCLVVVIQPIAQAIAYLQDAPAIRYWHSLIWSPSVYPWTLVILAMWEYWLNVFCYFYGMFGALTTIVTFNTIDLSLLKLRLSGETAAGKKTMTDYRSVMNALIELSKDVLCLLCVNLKVNRQTVLEYRRNQLLGQLCNDCIRPLWKYGHAALLGCMVFCNCGAIILLHRHEINHFFIALVGSMLLSSVVFFTYPAGGRPHETSKELKRLSLIAAGKNRSSIQYARSFRHIAIYVGQFYYLDSGSTLSFLTAVVNYTVMLLMLKLN